jgi:hypothetical protein
MMLDQATSSNSDTSMGVPETLHKSSPSASISGSLFPPIGSYEKAQQARSETGFGSITSARDCRRCGSRAHTETMCPSYLVDEASDSTQLQHTASTASSRRSPNDPINGYGVSGTWSKTTYVWFCSECGEGPSGNWQNQCASCEHIRCEFCGTERTDGY